MSAYTKEQLQSDGLSLTFGYLLPVIAANATITYGRIAELLQVDLRIQGKIFPIHVGGVVGGLMDRIHKIDPKAPLINVLAVNQQTGLPSIGVDNHLKNRFGVKEKKMTPSLKSVLVDKAAREVYAFQNWANVYRKVFRASPPSSDPVTIVSGKERDGLPPSPVAKGRGGEAESEEHKALKAYVLKHPALFGLRGKPNMADTELLLLSGDEVDVYFETNKRVDLIEVESVRSNWNDLRRGIYQCIKYRAVFEAQRRMVTPDMRLIATLVVESDVPLGSDIQDLAKLHGVKVKIVNVKR